MIVSTVIQLVGLVLAAFAVFAILAVAWGVLFTGVPHGSYYTALLAAVTGPSWGLMSINFFTTPFSTDLSHAAAFGYGYFPTILAIGILTKDDRSQAKADAIYLYGYATVSVLMAIVPLVQNLSSSNDGNWFWWLALTAFCAGLGFWAVGKDNEAEAAKRTIAAENAKTINHGPATHPAADMPRYKAAPSSTHSDFDLPPQE